MIVYDQVHPVPGREGLDLRHCSDCRRMVDTFLFQHPPLQRYYVAHLPSDDAALLPQCRAKMRKVPELLDLDMEKQ